MTSPIYFVAGGTGVQGGAVIEHLLKIKPTPKIRTISRDLSSPAVKRLQEQGVEVIEGSQGDKEALKKGVAGAVAAFSVQVVIFTPQGIDGEREASDAQLLVDACKESGTVQLIVHTSLEKAGDYEVYKDLITKYGLTSFYQGKTKAEEAVRKSGLKYVILRPGNFASNYFEGKTAFQAPGLVKGEYYSAAERLELIVPDDIGAFAVAAFQNPAKFNGREIELISEDLTPEQIVEAFEAASGKKVKLIKFTPEEAEKQTDAWWRIPQLFSNARKVRPDTDALKREYPEIKFTSFREHLIKHKDKLAYIGTQGQ